MRIHFFVNPQRPDAVEAAIRAIAFVREREVEVGSEESTADILGIPGIARNIVGQADLIATFGGDGTLIRAADLASEFGTPVLGVYFGRFGFVTQCQPSDVGATLSEFFDQASAFEERMMLQCELRRNGQVVATLHALNDIALQREATARMMSFRVEVDGLFVTSYPADGVILATPTGSTAYNLSAGGPIVDPRVQGILLNPLAPHTLSSRPLILHPNSEIVLTVVTEGDSVLSVDGQGRLHVLSGDEVRVTKSERVTKLVCVEPYDFLKKLSERLLWSQSILG
ncbi:MAG: NAD(+)/NADH kinase [Fimbriimonadaceae bacterium]